MKYFWALESKVHLSMLSRGALPYFSEVSHQAMAIRIGASVSATIITLMTGLNLIAEYFDFELCYCSLFFRLDRVCMGKSLEVSWLIPDLHSVNI